MFTLNYESSRPNNIFSLKYVNADLVSCLFKEFTQEK